MPPTHLTAHPTVLLIKTELINSKLACPILWKVDVKSGCLVNETILILDTGVACVTPSCEEPELPSILPLPHLKLLQQPCYVKLMAPSSADL